MAESEEDPKQTPKRPESGMAMAVGPHDVGGGVHHARKGGVSGVCSWCVDAAKWLPVVFIVSIVTWSYYAYVVQLCIFSVDEWYARIPMLVLYHIFGGLFICSYWKTVFTNAGVVPQRFYLREEDMEQIETADNPKLTLERLLVSRDLPCAMRSMQQEVRYCSECYLIKPDRSHHCSVCRQCVLKMDHHCPWVNNCVAFMNYKFFILFLFYALLYCAYCALSSLKYFLEFWSSTGHKGGNNVNGRFHVLFLFFVAAMFCVSLASLFGYHVYLVSRNMTTLEAFRPPVFRHGPDKKAFHLGRSSNFQEVFGDNKWLWLLPVFSSIGDGLHYPMRNANIDDEESGRLLDNNGCPAVNPSSESPPQFMSEESVPMMLHTATETEDEDEVGAKYHPRHVTSSSGSSASSSNNGRVGRNANGTAVRDGLGSGPVKSEELVSVTM